MAQAETLGAASTFLWRTMPRFGRGLIAVGESPAVRLRQATHPHALWRRKYIRSPAKHSDDMDYTGDALHKRPLQPLHDGGRGLCMF